MLYTETRNGITYTSGKEGHCGCMEHAGFQKANWPTDCRLDITVSYQIDQIDKTLFVNSLNRALGLWQKAIKVRFAVLPTFTRDARIWITDAPLPGSTLAWSFLANNSCGARLEQRYDTLVDWTEGYLTATIVHEVGHALGLTHSSSRADVMYPSITMNTIAPAAGDIRRATAIGYSERTGPVPPTPPPIPEPEPEDPDMPRPPFDWGKILEILLPIIAGCITASGSRKATAASLADPSFSDFFRISRACRKAGLGGAELRTATREVWEALREASPEELDELIDEAAEIAGL